VGVSAAPPLPLLLLLRLLLLALPSALLRISSMPCCMCIADSNWSGSAVAGLILPTCWPVLRLLSVSMVVVLLLLALPSTW
jgi:hypothetical protein